MVRFVTPERRNLHKSDNFPCAPAVSRHSDPTAAEFPLSRPPDEERGAPRQ